MAQNETTNNAAGDDLIGRQLRHYEILRELGRGGMATVYLARQTNMTRQVAIKILPRQFLHDPQFIQRFKREVTLIAELEHPHILPVYDFGEEDGIPYIVMRYLGGGSLRDQLDQGLPPLAELEHPIEQVCEALDFAHAEGIIHRDLKPSNIILDDRGNAYLSDFGIAQIMQDAGRLTGSAVIGTPAYMSPEQAEGRPLDARSDVYAMGVVLFEMVTGREPFQADTPMAMLLKQITEPMPSPRAYRPTLPQAVEDVILRATQKDPAARYPSAMAFAEAFAQAIRQLPKEETSIRLPLPTSVERTYVPGQMDADTTPDFDPDDYHDPTVIGLEEAAAPTEAERPRVEAPAPKAEETVGPAPTAPAAKRSRRGLWIGLAALLVLVLAAGGVLVGTGTVDLSGGGVPTLPPPTPFPGANMYRGPDNVYQISVPSAWRRQDLSTDEGLGVLWYPAGREAFAAMHLRPWTAGDGSFSQAVEAHGRANYDDDVFFTIIDRGDQPDGSLRVSYRLPQPDALYEGFGPGQLDVFYYRVGDYFAAVTLFTADGADLDALLPLLQDVLSSLFIDPAVTLG